MPQTGERHLREVLHKAVGRIWNSLHASVGRDLRL